MLALLAVKGGHPLVKQMIAEHGTAKRHFDADKKLSRGLEDSLKFVPLFTPLGIYVGHGPSVNMEWNRWQRVAGKIVRGLYFNQHQKPVPVSHVVHVWQGDSFWANVGVMSNINQLPSGFASFGKPDELDDVFMGKCAPTASDPDGMIYLLIFYKTVAIYAHILPKAIVPIADPSHPEEVAKEMEARRLRKQQFLAAKQNIGE